MGRNRFIRAAVVLCALLAAGLVVTKVRADELFDRRTREADQIVAYIAQLTSTIAAKRAEAAAAGHAMVVSCLDTQLKAARENQAVAQVIRKNWEAAREGLEYRERSMERLLKLQVYGMVFDDDARHCASEEVLAKALEVSAPSRTTQAPLSPDTLAPPHLERPPLASPF